MIQNQIRVAQSIIAHFPDLVRDENSIQYEWVKLLNESIINSIGQFNYEHEFEHRLALLKLPKHRRNYVRKLFKK